MTKETATIIFIDRNVNHELLIPLDISANELAVGLNEAYQCIKGNFNVRNCYLSSENPIALLHGTKTLREFGVHDGTVIAFAD